MLTTARDIQSTIRRTIMATIGTAAILFAASPLEAQQRTAFGTGTVRATVETTVAVKMPVLMQFRALSAPTATAQAKDFTEYTMRFNVRTNTSWEVVAAQVPQGVTILSVDGAWETLGAASPTLHRGVPTNGSEVLVRVRVADGADIGWQQALRLEARRR